MKKYLIGICFGFLGINAYAYQSAKEIYLPPNLSAELDKLTSGAMGSIFIKKMCDGQNEKQAIKDVYEKLDTKILSITDRDYRRLAFNYSRQAMEQKYKAFSFVYKEKNCSDLDNLKDMTVAIGF